MASAVLKATSAVTVEYINNLSYPDFVGFINQWNVLPGAHVTLSKWANYARMSEESNILQFACTTGFQSRELALLTGCSGKAFDFSHQAVDVAQYNKDTYAPEANIKYFQADGHEFDSDERFSHVVIGAGLQFFPDPKHALERCIHFLQDGGFLLASPFYIKKPIPQDLCNQFKEVFGIYPTTLGYKDIMSMYQGLEVIYQDHNELIKETEEELHHYCKCTIDRACELRGISDQEVYDAMYNRLYDVKKMSNDLRPYQMYTTLVLRYRSNIYPNRYVELF